MANQVKRLAQVCRLIEGGLLAVPLCLPKLATIALYLEPDHPDQQPAFHVGVSLAPEQGAQGVCNALGRLVAADVLPALAQARVSLSVFSAVITYGVAEGDVACNPACDRLTNSDMHAAGFAVPVRT